MYLLPVTWFQQLIIGLPQPPPPPPLPHPLFPVLYNVCTKGLADLNCNGLSRVLTLADDGLIYKTASDIHIAVTAVQEQLEKVSHWCQETESEINPGKVQVLWCTLNNKAVGQTMPAVSFSGEVKERTNSLRYLWDPLTRNVDVQAAGRINTTQVQERTVRVESHGFKKASNVICSCCIRV